MGCDGLGALRFLEGVSRSGHEARALWGRGGGTPEPDALVADPSGSRQGQVPRERVQYRKEATEGKGINCSPDILKEIPPLLG